MHRSTLARRSPHGTWSGTRLGVALVATLGLLGCGGGGGTNPPPGPTTGSVGGTITLDPGLSVGTLPNGDRLSGRVIDPGDNIAGIPGPSTPDAGGNFLIGSVPSSNRYYWVNVNLVADVGRTVVVATPISLNVPAFIATNVTTDVDLTIASYTEGGLPVGLRITANYSGPDGKRASQTIVNFDDSTVRHDLNGDGTFDDSISPDDDNDGLDDSRNSFDSSPGTYTEQERQGVITAIVNDQVTVGGLTFTIVASTLIFDHETDETLRLSDFNVGDPVNIRGYEIDGTLFANRLRREDKIDDDDPVNPLPGEREIEREDFLLQGKTASTVTIADMVWQITGSTEIENKDTGADMLLADIPLGGCVDIKGNVTGDGIIATRLRYDPTCDDGPGGSGVEIEEEGRVTAIDYTSPRSITVNGRLFAVPDTGVEIVDKDNDDLPIPLESIVVNDFVDVRGILTETTLTANRIRLDEEDDD